MIYFVFDVDGTLTPSRGTIDSTFGPWFTEFAKNSRVCYVTGSDRAKTVEQIGQELFDLAHYSFNCTGNEVYQKGQLIYSSKWELPVAAWIWLDNELNNSHYPHRFGNHFEQRTGLLNFSVVGRNAVGKQRTEYYEWDKLNKERSNICVKFNKQFPELNAQIGGETGIDIFPAGKDKSQILDRLDGFVYFFGDRMDPEGNDRPLADRIIAEKRGKCYNVKDWYETWNILHTL